MRDCWDTKAECILYPKSKVFFITGDGMLNFPLTWKFWFFLVLLMSLHNRLTHKYNQFCYRLKQRGLVGHFLQCRCLCRSFSMACVPELSCLLNDIAIPHLRPGTTWPPVRREERAWKWNAGSEGENRGKWGCIVCLFFMGRGCVEFKKIMSIETESVSVCKFLCE